VQEDAVDSDAGDSDNEDDGECWCSTEKYRK
jgi:hypothetical protein